MGLQVGALLVAPKVGYHYVRLNLPANSLVLLLFVGGGNWVFTFCVLLSEIKHLNEVLL